VSCSMEASGIMGAEAKVPVGLSVGYVPAV
jgi:hypothetical protein